MQSKFKILENMIRRIVREEQASVSASDKKILKLRDELDAAWDSGGNYASKLRVKEIEKVLKQAGAMLPNGEWNPKHRLYKKLMHQDTNRDYLD